MNKLKNKIPSIRTVKIRFGAIFFLRPGKDQIMYILLIVFMTAQTSCSKLVEVDPPGNSINSGNVYNNDATAIAAVTHVYAEMSRAGLQSGGFTSMSLFPALSADEFSLFGGATNNSVNFYYTNALTGNIAPPFWKIFYQNIYTCNAAIEGISTSTGLTMGVKNQLLGEVKFMRAFCYFYLVNLYGDVPLALGTDHKVNSILSRVSKADVYQQIINDLTEAQNLLSPNYLGVTLLTPSAERVRPIKWAATALLARTYLYTSDWTSAEIQATTTINQSTLYDTVSLNSVFKKNSKEAIWQLQPVNAGWNTEDARTFILPASGPNNGGRPFYLSPYLLTSFEINDRRMTDWVSSVSSSGNTYYYPYKYKSATFNDAVTEYSMVLRIGEQYLIRAEARARLNNFSGAQNDLNMIRKRAGLPNTTAADETTLLVSILKERKTELFSEWGHRWLDLKRTGNVDVVMGVITPQKGGIWNTNWQWYPLPNSELQLNPNLVQNVGY